MADATSSPTEPCPHCGCPVASGEWFEDDEGTASCACCAIRDGCDPNDPDCTCRREDAIVQEHARLLPNESLALTVALAQVRRGEEPQPNTAAMCVLALARLDGRFDWTQEAPDGT